MRRRNRIIIIIISLVILVGLIVTGITYCVIANGVISGMSDVRVVKDDMTLAELDLSGYSIEVTSSDGVPINAYIISRSDAYANVIILHGMHGMDATSTFEYAKFIYDAGYNAICVDMRAHGKSGGESLSFGYLEPLDIIAVIDYIEEDSLVSDKPIVLYGLSMGGSVAINAASISDRIEGVIAVSPFMSIQAQVNDYMERDGAPRAFIKSFIPAVNSVLRFKFRVNPVKNSPIKTIKTIGDIPIYLIHGDNDMQTRAYHSEKLYEASASTVTDLWIVEGADHLIVEDVLSNEAAFYREAIIGWLDGYYRY